MAETILHVDGLTVRREGLTLLEDISLSLAPGELHCVVGPGGAGKGTLVKVLLGQLRPTTGTLRFLGNHDLVPLTEPEILRLGLRRKGHAPAVSPGFSVGENLELALGLRSRLLSFHRPQYGQAAEAIAQALAAVGLSACIYTPATALSPAGRQWLEIAMALVQAPRLLLLEEPQSGMSPAERSAAALRLRGLAGRYPLLIVTADQGFARLCGGELTLLQRGRVCWQGPAAATFPPPAGGVSA